MRLLLLPGQGKDCRGLQSHSVDSSFSLILCFEHVPIAEGHTGAPVEHGLYRMDRYRRNRYRAARFLLFS